MESVFYAAIGNVRLDQDGEIHACSANIGVHDGPDVIEAASPKVVRHVRPAGADYRTIPTISTRGPPGSDVAKLHVVGSVYYPNQSSIGRPRFAGLIRRLSIPLGDHAIDDDVFAS